MKTKKYEIVIKTKQLTHQWWGKQWCDNIERYSTFVSRLERGRSYIRAGRVHDITIKFKENAVVYAKVKGSRPEDYDEFIVIKPLPTETKEKILNEIKDFNCFKNGLVPEDYRYLFNIGESGLFPTRRDIEVYCGCPDDVLECKHILALLYGIGCIIDKEPLLLFQLRGIDVDAYLDADIQKKANDLLVLAQNFDDKDKLINDNEIASLFGIELAELSDQTDMKINNDSSEEVHTIIVDKITEKKEKPKAEKPVNPNRLIIRQYDLCGKFIAQFENYDEAEKMTGVAKRSIQRNACGEKKRGGGFLWKKVPANVMIENVSPVEYEGEFQKKPVNQYD